MGDEGDRAPGQRIGLVVADGAQPVDGIDEPHAPGTAQRHARARRDGGEPRTQVRYRWQGGLIGRAEDHRRPVTPLRREPELALKGRVGYTEQHKVDRAGTSESERRQRVPPMSAYRGFTRCVRGADGLRATSSTMRCPKLPGRELAPTIATLLASSIALRPPPGPSLDSPPGPPLGPPPGPPLGPP